MRNHDAKIVETFASNEYVTLERTKAEFTNNSLNEDQRPFAYERYATEVHPPIEIELKELLKLEEMPRCLDMPLRLAGETEYRLPLDWLAIKGVLEKLVSIEESHNPNWRDYNTYMTIDAKDVTVGEQQRHGGLHVDGFQGTRIVNKTKVTRNYVATSNGGTQFWPQRFVVADPEKFNAFKGFDLQVEGEPFVAKPDRFYFMDAFTVHESGYAEFDGKRVFIRLTYDLKEFDRLGNTRNPNLDYDWSMVARNAQDLVEDPRLTDIIASPYFPNP